MSELSCPWQAALELLADIIEPPLLPFSGATLSAEAQAANIAAFRRSAEATVDVLQGLLLLLGYLAEEHFLAGWELPELGELQRDVVPQASCLGHLVQLCLSQGTGCSVATPPARLGNWAGTNAASWHQFGGVISLCTFRSCGRGLKILA